MTRSEFLSVRLMRSPARFWLVLCSLVALSPQAQGSDPATPVAWAFSAGLSPAYHVQTMRPQPGARAVVTASLDGTTACFSLEGRPLWSAKGAGGFSFDLELE